MCFSPSFGSPGGLIYHAAGILGLIYHRGNIFAKLLMGDIAHTANDGIVRDKNILRQIIENTDFNCRSLAR